jgi:hypothetical protein
VDGYIRRRYPLWQRRKRELARGIVAQIPDLAVRPMLLAHVEDLVHSNVEIRTTSELYEEMVNAWIRREEEIISRTSGLRHFSERLAVDLYLKRAKRGAERIPAGDLRALAVDWGAAIDDWRLTGRSLLNRDVEGNYKFAHRSLMEYLFVCRFVHVLDLACLDSDWTDQMRKFLWQAIGGGVFRVFLDLLAHVLVNDPPRTRGLLRLLRQTLQQEAAEGWPHELSAMAFTLVTLLSQAGQDDASIVLFELGVRSGKVYPKTWWSWGSAERRPRPSEESMEMYAWLVELADGRNFDLSISVFNAKGPVLRGLQELADLGNKSLFCVELEPGPDDCRSAPRVAPLRAGAYVLTGLCSRQGAFTGQRIAVLRAAVAEWLRAHIEMQTRQEDANRVWAFSGPAPPVSDNMESNSH